MKIWNDEEVKILFNEVETCKNSQGTLRLAFSNHAQKYKRKSNSVRNYYYHEVDNLKIDKKRCEKLGIDLKNHTKSHFVAFNDNEEKSLVGQIENLTRQGMTVRSACLKLSNGDICEMTRLQNKYQNMKKKNNEMKSQDNIIPFKQRQKMLTESDINSLFMGLVKLIKRTAVDDIMERTKQEKESSSYLLKKAFVDLSKKDKQISQLREDFMDLKKENQSLVERLNEIKENKKEALKEHLNKKRLQTSVEN